MMMKNRMSLLLSLFALLSLLLIDGADAASDPEEFGEGGKWESNPDTHPIRLPISESARQLLLGFDPRQRFAGLSGRQRTAGQRWALLPGYQTQYDPSQPGEEEELDDQALAASNAFASRLVDAIMPASKRLQNILGPRLQRGVGMMRMG